MYIHGNNALLANMDIDCDGDQSDHGDGRCGQSTDTQATTAFQDQVQQYSKIEGHYVSDVNANYIPYVVFGNYGSKSGYTNFHPEDHGLQPLSVMAVVCGNKLVSFVLPSVISGFEVLTEDVCRCMVCGEIPMVMMERLLLGRPVFHLLQNASEQALTATLDMTRRMCCILLSQEVWLILFTSTLIGLRRTLRTSRTLLRVLEIA